MNTPHFESLAVEQTRRLIRLACDHYAVSLAMPEVRFDLRGKAAGMVLFRPRQDTVIRYNRMMLLENGSAFLEQTVPHEVAHLVARGLHGTDIRPHGVEWRSIMTRFGATPTRCHNFPISRDNERRQMRHFHYRCRCMDHRLSAIRHNRSQAGTIYLCRRCGSPLAWAVEQRS